MVIVTAAQMKSAEQYVEHLGISMQLLMERAGYSAARFMEKELNCQNKQVVLLCGKGNNGGDACAAAHRLIQSCSHVTLILTDGQPVTRQANAMFEKLADTGAEIVSAAFDKNLVYRRIASADFLVDGVFGTGFHGALDPDLQEILSACSQSAAVKVALDLPSGMEADTGRTAQGCFNADYTVVFGAYKKCHFAEQAGFSCGKIHLEEIGIPGEAYQVSGVEAYCTDEELVRSIIPRRQERCHKGEFGRALCLCGSLSMSGAAWLSASGALKAGAGLVTLAAPKSLAAALAGRLIEATYLPLPEDEDGFVTADGLDRLTGALPGKTAVLAGCGLGMTDGAACLIEALLMQEKVPVVLDADGLNLAARHKDKWKAHTCPLILTPHPGELERLTGEPEAVLRRDRRRQAEELARSWNAVAVLKGHETVICAPDGRCYYNFTGNPGLAKGGSGDLLAGLIVGLLAQGAEPAEAAAVGTWLLGTAADKAVGDSGEAGLLASETAQAVGQVWASIHR